MRGAKKSKYPLHSTHVLVAIKSDLAKHLHIPSYEGLTVKAILDFGMQTEQLSSYMPDERDLAKLPRQWIINVVFSVVGDDLRAWVSDQIKTRNEKLAAKQDLMIELDPEIASAFGSSLNISSKSTSVQVNSNLRNSRLASDHSDQGARRPHPQGRQQAKEAAS